MKVVGHHTAEELKGRARNESHAGRHLRLRAVILAHEGWTAMQIAEALGKSVRTIQQWIGDYNRQGLDGLKDRRGGNRRYLSGEQEQQLRDHLDASAADPERGIRQAFELIPHIEQHFGVTYSLSGVYALLARLGYEWLMPRPRHPKADPKAQEAFKKTPPRWCSKSPSSTRTSVSKCGSRTKPGSGNRVR